MSYTRIIVKSAQSKWDRKPRPTYEIYLTGNETNNLIEKKVYHSVARYRKQKNLSKYFRINVILNGKSLTLYQRNMATEIMNLKSPNSLYVLVTPETRIHIDKLKREGKFGQALDLINMAKERRSVLAQRIVRGFLARKRLKAAKALRKLTRRSAPKPSLNLIFVRKADGKQLALEVDLDAPISSIKKIIFENDPTYPVKFQTLIFNGKKLTDNMTLRNAGVERQMAIYLVNRR